MSLKDAARWVEPNFVITKEGKQRYQPIRQKDMVAFITVTTLRAWLEEQHTSIVGKATVAAMLAELEGLS